ncbi:hypothetical protein [Bradyrhizobium sp.]|jgi:hypothetical protein|uniref:hypothetical protein n=1 Tax=Bradyrhizobium sp. TaxID=376 RepID=UPI003C729441
MPADLSSDDIAVLLHILEKVERKLDQAPLSNLRQLAELHHEARSELANFATADQSTNRIVERIATAMTKVRVEREES